MTLAFFFVIALLREDWAFFERSGAVIALLGALLGLRKLFRKGAHELATPLPPLVVNGNELNIAAIFEGADEVTDSFAQELGLAMVIAGTAISSLGPPLLQFFAPF